MKREEGGVKREGEVGIPGRLAKLFSFTASVFSFLRWLISCGRVDMRFPYK